MYTRVQKSTINLANKQSCEHNQPIFGTGRHGENLQPSRLFALHGNVIEGTASPLLDALLKAAFVL